MMEFFYQAHKKPAKSQIACFLPMIFISGLKRRTTRSSAVVLTIAETEFCRKTEKTPLRIINKSKKKRHHHSPESNHPHPLPAMLPLGHPTGHVAIVSNSISVQYQPNGGCWALFLPVAMCQVGCRFLWSQCPVELYTLQSRMFFVKSNHTCSRVEILFTNFQK